VSLLPGSSPGSYTWTFPGCPIQIRVRLDIVDALQHLVERAQDPETEAPMSGGLLLGDTASPGVTEIAGIEPLVGLDTATVEATIGRAECEVVGYFRVARGSVLQPGAGLQMTEDDVTLAAGLFRQPSSVVLLIETIEAATAKAVFFFWDGGRMLGDFSLMDFPLDSHQLAAWERQRTTPRASRQIDQEFTLEPPEAPAISEGGHWRARVACVGAIAILGMAAYFYSTRPIHRLASDAQQALATLSAESPLAFRVDREGTDLLFSWDRRSLPITGATFGMVLIREHGRARNVALTPEQLRFGRVRYRPSSDEVDIELNVAAGDHLVKESVIAVLP